MLQVFLISTVVFFALVAFQVGAQIKAERRREQRKKVVCEGFDAASQATIQLIGREAYDEMTERIDRLLAAHANDSCVTVNLTCGSERREGSDRLHSILPGEPVTLAANTQGGLERVDVYSEGICIGSLLLVDAERALDTMRTKNVSGAFVAEQNGYGMSQGVALRVIIFYTSRETERVSEESWVLPYRTRIGKAGKGRIDLFQN